MSREGQKEAGCRERVYQFSVESEGEGPRDLQALWGPGTGIRALGSHPNPIMSQWPRQGFACTVPRRLCAPKCMQTHTPLLTDTDASLTSIS